MKICPTVTVVSNLNIQPETKRKVSSILYQPQLQYVCAAGRTTAGGRVTYRSLLTVEVKEAACQRFSLWFIPLVCHLLSFNPGISQLWHIITSSHFPTSQSHSAVSHSSPCSSQAPSGRLLVFKSPSPSISWHRLSAYIQKHNTHSSVRLGNAQSNGQRLKGITGADKHLCAHLLYASHGAWCPWQDTTEEASAWLSVALHVRHYWERACGRRFHCLGGTCECWWWREIRGSVLLHICSYYKLKEVRPVILSISSRRPAAELCLSAEKISSHYDLLMHISTSFPRADILFCTWICFIFTLMWLRPAVLLDPLHYFLCLLCLVCVTAALNPIRGHWLCLRGVSPRACFITIHLRDGASECVCLCVCACVRACLPACLHIAACCCSAAAV